MFTLLSRLVGLFLGDQGESVPDAGSQSPGPDSSSRPSSEEFPWLIQTPADPAQSNFLNGTVTHVFGENGLINGHIYFSLADLHKEDKVQVGEQVHVRAMRDNDQSGWYSREVTVSADTWEQSDRPQEIDLRVLQSQVVVGKVTAVSEKGGVIDADICFLVEDCKDGFIPVRGDWVSANVLEEEVDKDQGNEDGWSESCIKERKAYNICPSRARHLDGCVTFMKDNHGYIDNEIFFYRTACINGYRPSYNDRVKVYAVESSQGKCEWRAVTVVPLSSLPDVYRSRQFRQGNRPVNRTMVIPGQRPKSLIHQVQLPVKLPHYTVPEKLQDAVLEGTELTEVVPHLLQNLSFINYTRRMSALLHLEEIQMQMDIEEFDMERVCLQVVGEFLALTVPGLAEGRPSVLVGDKIILSDPTDPEGPSYLGYVHELTSTAVHIRFNPEFHNRYTGEDYNVRFTFSRTSLRRCHQAVSLAVQFLGSQVLFPSQVELKEPQVNCDTLSPLASSDPLAKSRKNYVSNMNQNSVADKKQNLPDSLDFVNKRLNQKQKSAVRNILLGQARPTPYVIFGPPGTGKTMTVVEAILQLLKHVPSSRILVCTPSNSAADLIAERLFASGLIEQTQMVRLNAVQRCLDAIPDSIIKFCRFAEDIKMISRFRVIVSTCTMAGSLYNQGLRAGHITHVFVDECGQATEPECLIPVGLLSGGDGQIILAGDPQQLGPVVMSPFASMYGLSQSFLERLMQRQPYLRTQDMFQEDSGFNPQLVTMLVDNYRSHPQILELSSRLFYFGQLCPMADPQLSHRLVNWEGLPRASFPIIFHGSRGEDIREANSPSWFNPSETVQVVTYLQRLLGLGLEPQQFGVIAPYRKQVEKIRLMMSRLAMPDIKVGSVEEFQGQERQVIIISTVRSNEKLIKFDVRHSLGFLSSPKRFNVAITRAQALLIIVGNPLVLSQDHNWRQLIQFCIEKGGYISPDQTGKGGYISPDQTGKGGYISPDQTGLSEFNGPPL